jgi:hypothetical protein
VSCGSRTAPFPCCLITLNHPAPCTRVANTAPAAVPVTAIMSDDTLEQAPQYPYDPRNYRRDLEALRRVVTRMSDPEPQQVFDRYNAGLTP